MERREARSILLIGIERDIDLSKMFGDAADKQEIQV